MTDNKDRNANGKSKTFDHDELEKTSHATATTTNNQNGSLIDVPVFSASLNRKAFRLSLSQSVRDSSSLPRSDIPTTNLLLKFQCFLVASETHIS